MSDITRGSGRRNAKLAALPIGVAGRAVGGLGKRIAGKSKDEFVAIMDGLDLPKPRLIDVAVPANLVGGSL